MLDSWNWKQIKKKNEKWVLWPFVFENGRISEEVEENSLKMRTGKPRRDRIRAMKNPALWNDGVVELGGGVEGEFNGRAWESGEEIFEEMDFEEIVEKVYQNSGEYEQVMPEWNKRKSLEKDQVTVWSWSWWCFQFHGNRNLISHILQCVLLNLIFLSFW